MSSTAATALEAPPAPAGKGKKKLIIIIATALAVLLAGGGAGAYFLLKKKPADAEAEAEGHADGDAAEHAAPAKAKVDPKNPPVFVPLEHFTVNLADRDAERYAQIAVTLEVDDAKVGEQVKLYMPAIRNNILMAIADRSAGDLMERQGKAQLAERIKRETSRALGYDVGPDDDDAAPEAGAKPRAKAKKKAPVALPVRAVHFSNFIIQ